MSVIDIEPFLMRAREASSLMGVGLIAAEALKMYYPEGAGLAVGPVRNGGIIIGATAHPKKPGKLVGGAPSIRKNLQALNLTILALQEENEIGVPVFNQLDFKGSVDRHLHRWKDSKMHSKGYYTAILSEFYGPILGTGLIAAGFFLPHWKSSKVCKFVHGHLTENKKFICELPERLSPQYATA
ncbi:MAG: hypothetical protein V4436_00110 [Patescibacteria group bacterium]